MKFKSIVFCFLIAIMICFTGCNKVEEDSDSSSAFFISDGNGYALFNENGKRLTDFIYKSDKTFFNHATEVENLDSEYAILKDNGKYLVDFGVYKVISQYGALYKVMDYNSNSKIITADNKTVLEGNYSLTNPYSNNYLYLAESQNEDKIIVLDYHGNIIDRLDKSGNSNSLLFANVDVRGNYALLIYGEDRFLYDLISGKKIEGYDYDSQNAHYISDNRVIIYNEPTYKVFENGKKVLEFDAKEFRSIKAFNDGYLAKESSSSSYTTLIDKNGKIIAEDVYSYMDFSNYVIYNKDTRNYDVYSDNKFIKSLNLLNMESDFADDYYRGKLRNTFVWVYYNNKGEPLKNDDPYKWATNFNKYGYAQVQLKSGERYIIDKNNNKIIEYERMNNWGKNEEFTEVINGSVKTLLNSDLTELEKGYNDIMVKYDNHLFVEYDDRIVVYDYDTQNKLSTIKEKDLEFDEFYAYKTIDGKTQYFSYITGNMFYKQ